MGATAGTAVVGVCLAYRYLKACDLKMIMYLFVKLLKYMGVSTWKYMGLSQHLALLSFKIILH